MKKFEYLMQNERLDERTLNHLGKSGWELVTAQILEYSGGLRFHYIFKRQFGV